MIGQAFTFPALWGLLGVELFVIGGAALAWQFRHRPVDVSTVDNEGAEVPMFARTLIGVGAAGVGFAVLYYGFLEPALRTLQQLLP